MRTVLVAYLMVSGSDGFWKLLVPSAFPAVSGLAMYSSAARATGLIRLGGMMLPGNGSCWNRPPADRPPRERVVDLVLRAERQQLREVAVPHLLGRHGRRAVVARPGFVDALEAVHEERLAAPVVAREHHRAARGSAVAVVGEIGQRDVVRVGEEVVGEQLRSASC